MVAHATLLVDGAPREVLAFRGRERLSSCFRFDVELRPPGGDARAWLGERAVLTLEVAGEIRTIAGVVGKVQIGRHGGDVMVRLVPGMRLAAHRRTSRVFQDIAVVDIARRILHEHGLALEATLTRRPTKREMCVQHQESDLAFIERLFAEVGYAYRFETVVVDGVPTERVHVFDAATAYREISGDPRLVFQSAGGGGTAMRREEHHVTHFVEDAAVAVERVLVREFDFRNPASFPSEAATVAAGATAAASALDAVTGRALHEHHGPRPETQVAPVSAAAVLDQARRKAQSYAGESETIRIAPGLAFELEHDEDASLAGPFAVIAVEHELRPQARASSAADAAGLYSNRFRAVRRAFAFRPPRPRPRVRQSLETATVVGPENEEVFTDELGRIRVRFHWDLEPHQAGSESMWIRVAQAWAGAGYGAQFIPRVGMEVLVGFLGGDPDRPVVTGCLANATHPPPFQLPGGKLVSGFRGRSSPEDVKRGGNLLAFDDTRNREAIRVVGERDIEIAATNDLATKSGKNHAHTVASSYTLSVGGSFIQRVTGPVASHFTSQSLDIADSWSARIGGGYHVKAADGATMDFDGSLHIGVEGAREDKVVGMWKSDVDGDWALTVGTMKKPAHAEIQVRGTYHHATEKKAVVESKEELRLVCGASAIVLSPDGITIETPALKMKAKSIDAAGDGPSLRLTDRAELSADEVKIRGKKSSVKADDSGVEVKGDAIKMSTGEKRPTDKDDEKKDDTQKFSIVLTDKYFEPYANKHFELRAGSVTIEGETDGDGKIEEDVPKDARLVRVELWVEDYPNGERKEYACVMEPIPDGGTAEGMRARLSHLGYYDGPTDGEEIDEPLAGALRTFQRDHGLEPTGKIDEPTKSAVLERHGS